jgi:predicted Zn-dependent protease
MKIKHLSIILFTVFMLVNCNTNPFTGKSTIALVSNDKLIPMSFQQYNQVLSESNVVESGDQAEMIKRVGNKIKVAAERWLDANGYQGYTSEYDWEFSLIDEDIMNAWAMPGGKVAFYTGILPVAEHERGIALIMGHEVAHALANHGQQRMSKGLAAQLVGTAGAVALSQSDISPEAQQGFMMAYGLGSQGLIMAYSRKHETEADRIGIMLMAIAGYDPTDAYKLWERMAAASNGQQPPVFLSTHPTHETRIENLKKWAPAAKEEAKKFGVTSFK